MTISGHRGTAPVDYQWGASLDSLMHRFESDKAIFDPARKMGHGYTEHYERELGPLRQENSPVKPPPRTLLEIGIFTGASMRAFAKWLGPHWKIVGLDIAIYAEAMPPPDVRTTYYQGNARDRDFCRALAAGLGPLQVVIDDGSHEAEDQIRAFENFWPHVAPGGLYVIEDLHANYWGGHPFTREALDFLSTLVDDCHGRGKWANWSGVLLGEPHGRELEIRSVRFFRNMAILEKYREPPSVAGRVWVNRAAMGAPDREEE